VVTGAARAHHPSRPGEPEP